jgi:hypothetical protein
MLHNMCVMCRGVRCLTVACDSQRSCLLLCMLLLVALVDCYFVINCIVNVAGNGLLVNRLQEVTCCLLIGGRFSQWDCSCLLIGRRFSLWDCSCLLICGFYTKLDCKWLVVVVCVGARLGAA